MSVTADDVARIAALAQLDLTPEEGTAMVHDLSAILDYVAQLGQIDTTGVTPLAHLAEGEAEATFRDDEVHACFSQAEALANAPAQSDHMFEVPKIL